MKKNMIRLVCVWLLLWCGQAVAQDSIQTVGYVVVKANTGDYTSGRQLEGIEITLQTQGEKDTVYVTDSTGRAPDIRIGSGTRARLVFSGPGRIKKTVDFDLTGLPVGFGQRGVQMELQVGMLRRNEMVNCSQQEIKAIEEAVYSTCHYNPKTKEIEWDTRSFERMRRMVEECLGD